MKASKQIEDSKPRKVSLLSPDPPDPPPPPPPPPDEARPVNKY